MYALPFVLVIRMHRAALDARRRDRTWRYFAWSIIAGLLAGVLGAIALGTSFVLFEIGWWPLALAVLALFAVPILQPAIQRHALVPLGMTRTAFWLAHFSSMRDSDALALCCGAWAHGGRPTPAGEAWLCHRRDKRMPLGDAEIVTTGLLAAARGDADTARQLLRSIDDIVEIHPVIRELAGEWLACDAAERGAWAELAADAAAARWPATSLTYLLEGIAARNVGAAGAPSPFELRARWLLAPHRGATRGWLAIAPSVSTVATPTAPEQAPDPASLPRAVAAHLEVSTRVTDAPGLARAVHAWDLALADDATRTWLATRALELDAPLGAVDRAIKDVARVVTDELARLADAAELGAPPSHGPVGDALARRLRHGRLDALEAGFTRWAQRRHEYRNDHKLSAARPAIDEWREFIALRTAYDVAVRAGGLELRRLAFPHAYTTGTNMAAWLWNSFHEYALSHAISKWLLAEALAVGDTEAIDLCTRNAQLGVPTRMGQVGP